MSLLLLLVVPGGQERMKEQTDGRIIVYTFSPRDLRTVYYKGQHIALHLSNIRGIITDLKQVYCVRDFHLKGE